VATIRLLDVFSSSRTRIGQDEIRNFERLSGVSRKRLIARSA
jgi:hypothetical protein